MTVVPIQNKVDEAACTIVDAFGTASVCSGTVCAGVCRETNLHEGREICEALVKVLLNGWQTMY